MFLFLILSFQGMFWTLSHSGTHTLRQVDGRLVKLSVWGRADRFRVTGSQPPLESSLKPCIRAGGEGNTHTHTHTHTYTPLFPCKYGVVCLCGSWYIDWLLASVLRGSAGLDSHCVDWKQSFSGRARLVLTHTHTCKSCLMPKCTFALAMI